MNITSKKIMDKEAIPVKYTCDGDNISPELEFNDVPAEAKSLALVIDDPDAPGGTWAHWLVWNIDPSVTKLEENSLPPGAIEGMNSSGTKGYGGPCPPSGTHHYRFKLYALDAPLNIPADADKIQLGRVMVNHIIDEAVITGAYAHA